MSQRSSVIFFRKRYLTEVVPTEYNGLVHAIRNICFYVSAFLVSLLVAWVCVSGNKWLLWWGFALGLLVFNFIEYGFHRWISHQKLNYMANAYRRHVGAHHPYFACPEAVVNAHKDLHAILLPTTVAIAYFVLFGVLMGVPLWLIQGGGAMGGFLAAIALSVFQLDFLHLYYHLPQNHAVANVLGRVPYFRFLKRLHEEHHRQARPITGFNITHPLTDALLGTLKKRGSMKTQPERRL